MFRRDVQRGDATVEPPGQQAFCHGHDQYLRHQFLPPGRIEIPLGRRLQAKCSRHLNIRPREHSQGATWRDKGVDDMNTMLEMRLRHCLGCRWMYGNLYGEIDLSCLHPAQGIAEIFDKRDVHTLETVQREISLRDRS